MFIKSCKKDFWKIHLFSIFRMLAFFGMALLFAFVFAACDELVPVVTVTATQVQPTASPEVKVTRTNSIPTKMKTDTPLPVRQIELEPEDIRGTIIEYWHVWSGPTGEIMQALVDEFNIGNEWGILVVPVYQGTLDQMADTVLSAQQAGELPDLAVGNFHQILEWDSITDVVDLRSYTEDPFWGYSLEEQADFYPEFWGQGINNGRRLGVPAQRSAQMLYYNQSWARELGFSSPPTSPDQFREQACAAARANLNDDNIENDGTGGWIISTDYASMLAWIHAFGGDILRKPEPALGETVYRFDSPEVEETFVFLKGLFDEGCAWIAESQYPEAEFAGRLGLFSVGSVMDIPYQIDTLEQVGNKDEWTVIPFPSSSKTPAITVYGPSYVLFQSSPNEQLASWLFAKWLLEAEIQAQLVPFSGAFPLRSSTRELLKSYEQQNPLWANAVDLLPMAFSEPEFRSWSTVRWALVDASTQLFRSYFTIEQVPTLIEFLDQTAAELHLGPQESGIFHTPTYTLTPSHTPTRTLPPSLTPTITRTPWPSSTATNTPTERPTATQTAELSVTPEN